MGVLVLGQEGIPPVLVDLFWIVVALSALIALLATPPMKWLARNLFAGPFSMWLTTVIKAVMGEFMHDVKALKGDVHVIKQEFFSDGNGSLRTAVDELVEGMKQNTSDHRYLSKGLETALAQVMTNGARLNSLINIEDTAFFLTDASLQTISVNQAYMDLWGFTNDRQAIRSDEWMEYVADRELAEQRLATIAHDFAHFEFEIELEDGRWVLLVGDPIVVGSEFMGYTGHITEIEAP